MTFTTTPAARRAGVTVRTIKRWRAQGMPTTRNCHGWHLVTEQDLLAWKRRNRFMRLFPKTFDKGPMSPPTFNS